MDGFSGNNNEKIYEVRLVHCLLKAHPESSKKGHGFWDSKAEEKAPFPGH